jgi:hypothetical protein
LKGKKRKKKREEGVEKFRCKELIILETPSVFFVTK